mmetsp:Transcript_117949/g.313811  ORF Transcript_117949/g.313811 Transcript_117949/m.313811 type:complete len:230 (+) Transcript_117949:1209-1898(+)
MPLCGSDCVQRPCERLGAAIEDARCPQGGEVELRFAIMPLCGSDCVQRPCERLGAAIEDARRLHVLNGRRRALFFDLRYGMALWAADGGGSKRRATCIDQLGRRALLPSLATPRPQRGRHQKGRATLLPGLRRRDVVRGAVADPTAEGGAVAGAGGGGRPAGRRAQEEVLHTFNSRHWASILLRTIFEGGQLDWLLHRLRDRVMVLGGDEALRARARLRVAAVREPVAL